MERCAICQYLPGHQHVCPEAYETCDGITWVNTRTGEEFKVEAKPGPARTWGGITTATTNEAVNLTEDDLVKLAERELGPGVETRSTANDPEGRRLL